MDITRLSEKAFAVMAECEKTKQPFGITVDPSKDCVKLVWAFKIDKAKAHREGMDEQHVHGSISLDDKFNGCPYCGSKQFYLCSNCNSIICYHGEREFSCPVCGASGIIQSVDSIDLKGGGY